MSRYMTPVELQRRGMGVLVRELGYDEAIRFMLQFSKGRGDYTKERRKLLKDVTLDELLRESNRLVAQAKPPRRRRKSA